jgi:phosphoenolpyruvate carboxykinase (ATP)
MMRECPLRVATDESGGLDRGTVRSSGTASVVPVASRSLALKERFALRPALHPALPEATSTPSFDPRRLGLVAAEVLRNAPPALLYEHALSREDTAMMSSGALATFSGDKTGRSPKDKRIVEGPASAPHVWWGNVNIPASHESFVECRRLAFNHLNSLPTVYLVDGFAGWDNAYRVKVRVICARAYHALFMHNLLIRPSALELESFGDPEFVIMNAGDQAADSRLKGVASTTSVMLDLEGGEMVILGTNYAGEMKKGVFTAMNYWMPRRGVLSMHCSANAGLKRDTTLFFGLSGTGKTTLSSDPRRPLIGDDEHCWTDRGIFNIEGGCYAKCLNLSAELEPQIFRAIRFGAVLENVVFDPQSRVPDYRDRSITENTRACYPIEHIEGSLVPCVGAHPRHIIFLTCDAFGVLPPVSRLTTPQAMYHFLSGYTAKVAGTEVGVDEPQATFSACFGAAFMVLHPARYAELLAAKIREHKTAAWLVNTGWTGGPYGFGSRIKLPYTRAIVNAIHEGALESVPTIEDACFQLQVPTSCPDVPQQILFPRNTWADPSAYDRMERKLAGLFQENFQAHAAQASEEVREAGPRLA